MPSINTSDIIRASDSAYFVDIARVKKFILTHLLTYLQSLHGVVKISISELDERSVLADE